jgi:transposase InsO family protein
MFDLKKLKGYENEDGEQAYLMLIVDHFTKYKWGCIMFTKNAAQIANFLLETFTREGTPERWHADNGSEFDNGMVTLAREQLGLGNTSGLLPYTHGAVRYVLHSLLEAHNVCLVSPTVYT